MRIFRSQLSPWMSAAGAAALVLGSVAGLSGTASAAETMAPTTAPAQTGSSIATSPAAATPFVAASPATATAPSATSGKGAYKFFDSDFILRLRASAIQTEVEIPKPLVPGFGYSAVNLEKDIGGDLADCEIFGAGFYLTDIVQEGVLENSGPPDAGNKGGGIFNPTESKDTKPNLSPGENLNSRKPGIRSVTDGSRIIDIPNQGNGVRWTANCENDAAGKGVGNNVDLAGVEGVGSTTQGAVNKKTGEYTGVSRAYIAGLNTGSGTVDFIASYAKIKHMPGQKPVISFLIGTTGGTLAAGANVPYGEVTKTFNESLKSNRAALASIGPSGLTVIGPTESVSENGGRYIINFPFLELEQGFQARRTTVGQNQKLRLVNVDYEGLYEGGAIKQPGTGQLG